MRKQKVVAKLMNEEYLTKNKAVIYETTLVDIVGVQEEDIFFIGMKYIGQTVKDRESYLGSGYDFKLYRKALEDKYKKENVIFRKKILEVYTGEDNEEKRIKWLNEREEHHIELCDGVNSERYFNQNGGGDKNNSIMSEKTRKKYSEATTRRWKDPEYKKKMIEKFKRYHQDPKNKNGGWYSEKHRKFLQSQEYRNSQSEKIKKVWQDPEFRKHIISSNIALKRKPVRINGVLYESMTQAAKVFGITLSLISYRIKSKSYRFKDWNYETYPDLNVAKSVDN